MYRLWLLRSRFIKLYLYIQLIYHLAIILNFNTKDLQDVIVKLKFPFILMKHSDGYQTLWRCEEVNIQRQRLKNLIPKTRFLYFYSSSDTFTWMDLTLWGPSIFIDFFRKVGPGPCDSDHLPNIFENNTTHSRERVDKIGNIFSILQRSSVPICHH